MAHGREARREGEGSWSTTPCRPRLSFLHSIYRCLFGCQSLKFPSLAPFLQHVLLNANKQCHQVFCRMTPMERVLTPYVCHVYVSSDLLLCEGTVLYLCGGRKEEVSLRFSQVDLVERRAASMLQRLCARPRARPLATCARDVDL